MEFDSNKAIYLQICDAICERILRGELGPDKRIPSVREYGAEIGIAERSSALRALQAQDSASFLRRLPVCITCKTAP